MKKIKVLIQDKNTLKLIEPGETGDLIDLTEIYQLDTTALEKAIQEGKDQLYQQKLADYKKILQSEYVAEVNQLKNEIEKINEKAKQDLFNQKSQLSHEVFVKQTELENNYKAQYQQLQAKYQSLENIQQTNLQNKEYEVKQLFQDQIHTLQQQLSEEKNKLVLEQNKLKTEKLELEQTLKEKYEKQLAESQKMVEELRRYKSTLNVKRIGEDLETWCDNVVQSYMQNGLLNCTWTKDNRVVKEENEYKGTKADYIFRIYLNEKHQEELTSICLDMKSENPDSVNKKKNADYYATLDKNRNKKGCKYALLVSELEMDQANDLSIYKVQEYENMYVVRPSYLMVFLNMVTSLTTRFATLLTAKQQEELKLKDQLEIVQLFEDIKNTYLDKPLEQLKKQVENIQKYAQTIKDTASKIEDSCDTIYRNYINQITEKINKFDIKLEKSVLKKVPVSE